MNLLRRVKGAFLHIISGGRARGRTTGFASRRAANQDVEPDEIFIDSSNLPNFDTDQFEGRLEKPISLKSIFGVASIFLVICLVFVGQSYKLQIVEGQSWKDKAENNRLNQSLIFAERGVIQDRNGMLLAWNETDPNLKDYALRKYRQTEGTHNLLGYVRYPRKDKAGFYYNTEYAGMDGIELFFDKILQGETGLKLTETDVKGDIISESVMRPPRNGANITLTIDGRLQEAMYESIHELSRRSGFVGGAGMMMDVNTGEVLASVSFPEYDSAIMTSGTGTEAIKAFLADDRKLFLDRVSHGMYTPGSIVKPILAIAALNENVISPEKEIESTGELRVPNPYRPGEYTIFKDWRANGFTDMREAIAVSSDIYFYQIGGGFGSQKGLGIQKIDEYSKDFGFGIAIDKGFFEGKAGVIPTPDWKAKNFNGDIWRVGDTYNTSIGQYGFLVTPTQAIRAVAAIANGGHVVSPHIFKSADESAKTYREPIASSWDIKITNPNYYNIVREGMRMTVTDGTMGALNVPYVKIAGKTGTAQVGISKQSINSWAVGFFPSDKPKYAFVLMLEKGPSTAMFGASPAMAEFIGKVNLYAPEYFKGE